MTSFSNYNPRRYFLITFIATFLLWMAGAYCSHKPELQGLYMLFMIPGLMAPFIVSLVFVLKSKDRALRRDYRNRIINLRLFNPKTIPAFLFLMPVVVVVSALLSLLVGEPLEQFEFAAGFSFSSGFVPVLFLLLLTASFEELGWRGYALDSLQSRYNKLTASIVFAVLWSLWHLPLLFVKNSYQWEIYQQNPLFALNFFVSIVPLGVIINWIYYKNGKSVVAAILFHLIINLSQELFAITNVTKVIETFVLIVAASVIVIFDRKVFLNREHLKPALAV